MTVLVSDSFNRANSTTTLGSTDSYNGGTSKPWQTLTGTWGIISNQAYEYSGTSNGIAVVDSGQSDVTITCTVSQASTTSKIAFRVVDANDYWAWTPGTIFRQPWHAYSVSGDTWANGDVLKIVLSGSAMNFYRNGTLITTITDSTYQTATLHGLSSNSNTNYFDNFTIEGSSGSSTTTYIGSGTATGKSNLTSNETLILSEHGTVTGQSNNTSSETFVGATGTTYSTSGAVSGKSNLTSSETLILKSTGNAQGQSTLTSNEHEILSASGTIQGSSSLQSNENIIQHTGTIYSASGTVTGQSNLSSKETMSLRTNGEVKGQSSLTSNEKVRFFVTGIAQGQSSLKSNEKFISVKQIISRVTLQGSRELRIILEGNRELHVILEGNRELHVILKGGTDVPAENQNLTLEAGTDKIIDIPNIVDSTSPLDLTTCLEVHYQAKSGSTVISKDLTNGITVTSPTDLSIALLPADSHGLSGFFKHEVWCVDSNGKKSLLTKGNLIIKPSYADVN